MTEEELETIIDKVEDSGTLDEEQTDLLRNAVDFTKTPLEDIMTMREDIVGVDISMSQEEIFAVVRGTIFPAFSCMRAMWTMWSAFCRCASICAPICAVAMSICAA